MKGSKKTERKAPKNSRPAKKHCRPIIQYYSKQTPAQAHEDSHDGFGSPHDQPTPPTGAARVQPLLAGGVRKVSTTMLKSLQRRFVQQTLKSPFAGAPADARPSTAARAAEDFGADFVLHSSQTYERELSQARGSCGDDMEVGASYTEDNPTQTQFDMASQRRAWQELHNRLSQPSAEPSCSSFRRGQEAEEQAARRGSNASSCSYRTTPGGHVEDEAPNSTLGGAKLFPIFRSRKNLKVLHIIRHGESEYNAAVNSSRWEDPDIYDAPLTERGRRQALSLGEQLAALDLPEDTLFVTSPLTRAIQTLLLAVRALPAAATGPLNIVVRSEITERLTTRGDVGHPASVLVEKFPPLRAELQKLPEVWWHSDPANPNCALKKQLASKEQKKQLQKRIQEFKRWLLGRSERVIVAVGHSLTWRELMQEQIGAGEVGYMKNCELYTMHL